MSAAYRVTVRHQPVMMHTRRGLVAESSTLSDHSRGKSMVVSRHHYRYGESIEALRPIIVDVADTSDPE